MEPLKIEAQIDSLKELFPQGKVISACPELIWECKIQPTPLSKFYTIRLKYKPDEPPEIRVIGEKLSTRGSDKLPHVYSSGRQHLCLHYPQENSWTPNISIGDTIILWAAEWLYHYEIWLLSGKWKGGGTVH